ncbi:Bacteriophage abortive infection AbiH [Streptococcus equinus]|uniref:AbiH family protein n=1 Tax=Streptococcus equinus TaxID=1335 RepID=UPI0008716525|nr:AbiH family protein [Streptococcus equinus]SCW51470.1 Bacteriophage abortive infection AbiH [Streptococcus equinus]
MVNNILILGNGFDLAMGRKTSYEDFLRFLNSLSFLLSCQKTYDQQIDVKNYDFLLEEFEKILEDSESNPEEDFQNELEFYNSTHDDKVKLGILLEFLSNFFENKEPLRELSEDNRNFQDYNNFTQGSFRRRLFLHIRKIYEELDKQSVISKYFLDVDIIADLIRKIDGKNYKWLLGTRYNLFLRFINENKYKLGKKWSSIELVISDIAEAISYFKEHLEEFRPIFSNGFVKGWSKIQEKFKAKSNFAALSFVADYLIGRRFDYSQGFQKIMDMCNEEFIRALEELTDYLEFYLTYLDKLDFEKRIIKKKRSNLDAIEGLEKAKVLTFNYTDTANRLFGIPEKNTHFIHGRIDFARDKKSINTMVFGIEDKEDKTENINPDLISYQKFYQRIIKETGSDYRKFFEKPKNSGETTALWANACAFYRKFFEKPKNSGETVDDMNIIVFGHSVDPLDKEIFEKCFELAKERGGKYKFIFNYYDEKAKREIVKNLTIILEKEKMISLTAEQKVAFVKCDDVQRMKRELL